MAPAEGAAATRGAFAFLFLGQTCVALLVGAIVAWLVAPGGGGAGVLGVVLVGLAALHGPVGVAAALAPLPDPERVRVAALQRTLLAAVLLATPAWYLAFSLATGAGGWPRAALVAILGVYWLAGVLLATRLGARAVGG